MIQDRKPVTIEFTQERIDVTSTHSTPNERWRSTDDQGHEHYYEHGYPTLRLVIDASHWCDGSEGLGGHDPHEQVDESHYECMSCGQVIKPHQDPPFTPKSMPGRVDVTASGYCSDGVLIKFWLRDEDEVDRVQAMDPSEQQAFLDAMPEDRMISWSYESH